MSDGLINGLWIIPILAFLILIHEFGHFITARMVGVTVEEFGLGIPPRVAGRRWRGTLWSLNWIPFGGFVRVKGEDGQDMTPGSMNTKGPGQRAFFLAAGSVMNFLTAIILMFVLLGVQGLPAMTAGAYIRYVEPNSPAAAAGWEAADRIVVAGGTAIEDAEELGPIIDGAAGEPLTVVVERHGERIETTVTPRENPPADQGATGIIIGQVNGTEIFARQVMPSSPAAAAGWRAEDRLVAINGSPVTDRYIAEHELREAQGATVPVVIERDGERIETSLTMPVIGIGVADVEPGSPAADAELYPGDRIIRLAGEELTFQDASVSTAAAVDDLLRTNAGQTVPVTYIRNSEQFETMLTVPEVEEDANALAELGLNAGLPLPYLALGMAVRLDPNYETVPADQILPRGLELSWERFELTVLSTREAITNRESWDQITGPIGMGQIVSESLAVTPLPAWVLLTELTIFISLGLGLLNLLPIPALDGGRLFFVLIEIVRGGRRISPEKEGLVHLAGMALLLGLMFVIAYQDIMRLVDGVPLLP